MNKNDWPFKCPTGSTGEEGPPSLHPCPVCGEEPEWEEETQSVKCSKCLIRVDSGERNLADWRDKLHNTVKTSKAWNKIPYLSLEKLEELCDEFDEQRKRSEEPSDGCFLYEFVKEKLDKEFDIYFKKLYKKNRPTK